MVSRFITTSRVRLVVYLLLLIAYAKLDMEQHCKLIVHETDGLRGKGRTRMHPKLHLPVLGHAFRVTVVMAS